MSETAIWIAIIIVALAIGTVWANFDWNRKAARLRAKRLNPSRTEFVEKLLDANVDASVAEWLWERLSPEWRPGLSPHPNDNPLVDLPFDPCDPDDWQEDFCKAFCIDAQDFSDWPEQTEPAIANMAKWYSDELTKQRSQPSASDQR